MKESQGPGLLIESISDAIGGAGSVCRWTGGASTIHADFHSHIDDLNVKLFASHYTQCGKMYFFPSLAHN